MDKLTDFQVFIKVNKLKQKQVAEYLGTSTQYVNQVVNGKCSLSEDKLELLANSQWDTSMLDIPPYINIRPAVMTPLDGGEATPMMPIQANIDTGEVSGKKIEPIPATAEVIPIVPSEIASEVSLDVREFIEHNADELEHINPTKLLKNPDLAEQIAGTSEITCLPARSAIQHAPHTRGSHIPCTLTSSNHSTGCPHPSGVAASTHPKGPFSSFPSMTYGTPSMSRSSPPSRTASIRATWNTPFASLASGTRCSRFMCFFCQVSCLS